MGRTIVVHATWDPEASVWVAESHDLPLVTEAPSLEALQAKLPGMIEDLIEDLDGGGEIEIPLEVVAHQSVRFRARAA